MSEINVRIGGSHRLIARQFGAFKAAGIPMRSCGSFTLGGKAQMGIIPDTPQARELLKRVGGSVARKQWDFLSRDE